MQGQGLIGLGMRMLQGGKDKTGYGDLYDSLGVTRGRSEDPAKLLAAAIAASKMGDDKDITEDITEDITPELVYGPMFENLEGKTPEEIMASPNLSFPEGSADKIIQDYEDPGGAINEDLGLDRSDLLGKGYALGADFLRYAKFPFLSTLLEPTVLGDGTLYGNEYEYATEDELNALGLGKADGGRVEMQQGGMPMPALLGVSSGSTGTLPNYSMGYDPSAIPGPDYGTTAAPNYNYQAPQLTSLASPSINSSFDISSLLGGPDPFAVSYNPYVNATGTEDAYGQYGIGLDEDTIMDAFSDLDKYSLAAQEAKRKAAEEAAKKEKQGPEREGGGGGGNNNNNNNNNSNNNTGTGAGVAGAGVDGYGGPDSNYG